MPTSSKTLYRPSEVCDILGIPGSTLRYWSQNFPQINPRKTAAGHRRYTRGDIETCRVIMFLLRDKGLSVEYVRKEMERQRKYPPRKPRKCTNAVEAIALLEEVRSATEDAHAAASIDAVVKYLNTLEDGESETD